MRTSASAVVLAAGLLGALPVAAQETEARVHVVRPGETLWDIARSYLSDPFLWPEIFRLNADVVRDPARIYPDDRLVIPGARRAAPPRAVAYEEAPPAPEPAGPRFAATPPRPAVLEGDFHRAAFVATPAELRPVGRFVEPLFESVVALRMAPQVNLYDRILVQVDPRVVGVGDRLHFVRNEREIRRMGSVWRPTGVGTVAALDGETATVVVVGMFERVIPGDLAIPAERFALDPAARPAPVEADLEARILGFQDVHPLQRTESILFLDVGREAGVSIGDEFEAFDPPSRRSWGTRPEVRVARMQVVRVTDGTASVRVTELSQPRIAAGLPVRRVARMP